MTVADEVIGILYNTSNQFLYIIPAIMMIRCKQHADSEHYNVILFLLLQESHLDFGKFSIKAHVRNIDEYM